MKRALGFLFLTIACILGFLSIRGAMPFIPIFGSSMEPTLHSGGLLIVKPVEPRDIKVGDIIVYNVSPLIRDYYNYPPTVAHRVIEIRNVPSLGFRTKGDNTGEDPFTIGPQDIRGTVGDQIPYLGLPLLFFQSQQGLIFVVIALVLLAFFLYGGEINSGGRALHRKVFAPVIDEEARTNRVLTRKMEATEQRMNSTENALEKFAAAITEYARHLSSHTSAIQGLSEASHELKNGAAEQNRVLAAIMDSLGKTEATPKAPPPKEPQRPPDKPRAEVKRPRRSSWQEMHQAATRAGTTPGCARSQHPTPEEMASRNN